MHVDIRETLVHCIWYLLLLLYGRKVIIFLIQYEFGNRFLEVWVGLILIKKNDGLAGFPFKLWVVLLLSYVVNLFIFLLVLGGVWLKPASHLIDCWALPLLSPEFWWCVFSFRGSWLVSYRYYFKLLQRLLQRIIICDCLQFILPAFRDRMHFYWIILLIIYRIISIMIYIELNFINIFCKHLIKIYFI